MLIFDRNASQAGTDITHDQNSSQITLRTPGYYSVSFNGNLAPISASTLPLTIGLYLEQNSTPVAGAAAQHTFQNATDSTNLAFSQILDVTSVPATLQVEAQGGDFAYSGINLTVQKISSQPS